MNSTSSSRFKSVHFLPYNKNHERSNYNHSSTCHHNHTSTVELLPLSLSSQNVTTYLFCYLDSLTISNFGNIPLQQGNDIQCYNYTLTKDFNCTPNVAIGISFLTQQLIVSKHHILPIFSSLSRSHPLAASPIFHS